MIAIGKVFTFPKDWHQDDRANPLVRQYQLVLDGILQNDPDLQDCAVFCCHCGIRFLTHSRNAHRIDLRCPFGCREHHRRQRANERSVAYYRSEEAKAKKKRLNERRSFVGIDSAGDDGRRPDGEADDDPASHDGLVQSEHLTSCTCGDPQGGESSDDLLSGAHLDEPPPPVEPPLAIELEGVFLDENSVVNSPLLSYVRMVMSLIEGRTISCDELVAALWKRMRQHSMAHRTRREYVLHFLNQHPP